jgi:hypothetical protein
MIPLTLPPEARRSVLYSFWLVISLIFGSGVCAVASLLRAPLAGALGLIAGAACGALVVLNQNLTRRLYYAWDRRVAYACSRLASELLMRACFFIVFVATHAMGSRLRLPENQTSAWIPRSSLPNQAYPRPDAVDGEPMAQSGWLRSYISWACRTGNAWSLALLPFLWLLRLLSGKQEKALEANIYTLF